MNLTDSNASHWGRIQADACRRMWAAVVLGAYRDWWSEAAKARAIRDQAELDAIRADALRYFRGRDGKMVVALAGITADPERMADVAVDPDGPARITIKGTEGGDVDAW